jgi:hypothetical protein
MPVRDHVETGIAILQIDPVFDRAVVVAEVDAAGGPEAAEDE